MANPPTATRVSKLRQLARIYLLSRPLYDTRTSGERVLDLGCGWGFYFRINPKAFGIDLDGDSTAHLRDLGYKALHGDITEALPFEDESFDWVVCHDVLEHFELPDVGSILREVHRVLDVGGRFLIIVPNRKGYDFGCATGAGHRHFITPQEITSLSQPQFVLRRHYPYPFPRAIGQFFIHNKEVLVLEKVLSQRIRSSGSPN